jgi:hypothetical protein
LLAVTELTTDVFIGVTSVRMGAVLTLSPLTKLALVVVRLVIAGAAAVVTVVPLVKKPGVEVALVTTGPVVIPLNTGTVSRLTSGVGFPGGNTPNWPWLKVLLGGLLLLKA